MSRTDARTVDRKQLYDLVWSRPMIHVAAGFGISGNGLAKACRKLDIPCPPRGYWAKLAVGKAPPAAPLPPRRAEVPDSVRITAGGTPGEEEGPGIAQARADFAAAEQRYGSVTVPERLARPHPVIAGWLEDKKQRQERARRDRDPWSRGLWHEPAFTPVDRRRHRILHALFTRLEQEGGSVVEDERKALHYEHGGVTIAFQLREKSQQVRRPLSADEKRWYASSGKDWKTVLEPTGLLLFEFRTYGLDGLRKTWLESETRPMETLLPAILATFAAAVPLLVERKRQRDEEQRRWREREEQRRAAEQLRRLEAARWRRFVELAGRMREADQARAFLERIRALGPGQAEPVEGKSVGEWLAWAEERIAATDPLAGGAATIFCEVAAAREGSLRD